MIRVWCELVPMEEFGLSSPTGMIPRVKYSPILKDEIERNINYCKTYSHHLYLKFIEDPTLVFEYENIEDFRQKKFAYDLDFIVLNQ